MKITGKATSSLLLIAVMLTSCDQLLPTSGTKPTQAMETALAIVGTAIAQTQTAVPTATPTIVVVPSITPLPTTSPLPPTDTSTLTASIPFSGKPTVITMGNGLTWSECVVPNRAYARSQADMEFLTSCIDTPILSENDKKRMGERVKGQDSFSDLRITIGTDIFETKIDDITQGCCSYQLLKNGVVLLKMAPGFMTSDPNRSFWNVGGKLVWELGGYTSVIVVDGVNYNEKYGLEGSYFPYGINDKLIYIAKQNGLFHMVYDDQVLGPEFEKISMAYCCGMVSVYYGSGQYWFVGQRAGTKFIVSIR